MARRLGLEPLEERCLLSVVAVTNLNDSGAGSLREAIAQANATPNSDRIEFDVAGTINLSTSLPALSDASGGTTIDGTTAPDYAGSPIVEVDGTGAASLVLTITSDTNTLQGLAIRTSGTGILLSGGSGNLISNLDVSWTGEGKRGIGIHMYSSSGNTIESILVANRSTGIYFNSSSGNTIQCTSILDNGTGVRVAGTSAGIVLNYNHIAGNSTAGVLNSASAEVNAKYNYWGAADGPNPPGSGDAISANVDADPFLTDLPPCLVPAELVSYWRFDEGNGTIAGDSVDGSHGAIYGATWTEGIVGGALSFDGVVDYVQVPDSANLRPDAFTIECWVNIPTYEGQRAIVSNRAITVGSATYNYIVGITEPSQSIGPGKPAFAVGQARWGWDVFCADTDVSLNEWHHLAFVFDYDKTSKAEIYIDGVLDREYTTRDYRGNPIGPVNYTPDIPLHIGRDYVPGYDGPYYFTGLIDEVAIYSGTLKPQQVWQHYQNGLEGLGYEGNHPPVADAGGPYEVAVGGSVQLDGSGTTDPDQPNDTLTYEWDLDGDDQFGETGDDAARGDETAMTPTFSAAGLAGLSSVTVDLRVTDDGGLFSEDTATIDIVYVPDLSIGSSDIAFSPLNPDPGAPVTINATITNQGLVDASEISVSFSAFDTLIGEATIASLHAGATADVSIQTSFPDAGFQLITVKVDPDNTILELNEDNNEASAVLQVGEPPVAAAAIVVQAPPVTACQGRPTLVSGRTDYQFETEFGIQEFPVQGGQVTVTVIDPATSDIVFTGAHSDVNGAFRQWILAPVTVDTYTLLVQVSDGTVTAEVQSTLTVVECPTLPPVPTPPGTSGDHRDVFVFSEDVFLSDENPDLGEPITVFAFIEYLGAEPAPDVPVTINDVFPVAGTLQSFQIGSTLVDFPASPGSSTYVTISLPWTNTAEGAHVIQVVAEPNFPQNAGNDQATRLVFVGSPVESLAIDKSVALLVDADGNSEPTPGDTLEYTISFANSDTTEVTGAVILDDFDETLLQTPFDISAGGVVTDGAILWDLGTIAASASGSLTYQVDVKPVTEFPGGVTAVVNTALLDTDQTAPLRRQRR